ncbi:MAG: methylated-DNA--[protein]-cysteine S-methyltransferase [Acidobacteria bacterium]|nr:methylated-DNA--[protein]-cysteine S-methyltransferase [Acidobacteriota bacterium]
MMHIDHCESPIGRLVLAAGDHGLVALEFEDHWDVARKRLEHRFGTVSNGQPLVETRAKLEAYFAGEVTALDEVAVDPQGTPFQLRVWKALRAIPAGRTASYGNIARSLGLPAGASRAIGAANGSNPVAIVIPCHRVIRSDGALSGYGGGVERKRWLLQHEGAILL